MRDTNVLTEEMVRETLTKEQYACYQEGLQVVQSMERDERNLVEHLIEAEALDLPKAFELSSVYKYAIKIMGLTESVAGITINVARKSQQIPALRIALQNKQVTASKVHKFCSQVTESNVQEWIQYSSRHTAREIEDRMREQDPTQTKTHKLKLSRSAEKLLKRAQSLESQRQSKPVSREEAIEIALEFFVDRKDPVKRADRVIQKSKRTDHVIQKSKMKREDRVKQKVTAKKNMEEKVEDREDKVSTPSVAPQFTRMTLKIKLQDHSPGQLKPQKPQSPKQNPREHKTSDHKPLRQPLTAEQRNAVLARTRGCCTYVNARGERCNEDRWVDFHHIIPVKDGGTNDIENLTVLCGFHHDLLHQLELPFEGESSSRLGRASSPAPHS